MAGPARGYPRVRYLGFALYLGLTLGALLAASTGLGADQGRPSLRPVMLEQPWDVKSFERFLDGCRRDKRPYKLSLRALAKDCYEAERATGKIPTALRRLRGFTWFFGFVLDRENDDVFLLGLHDPQRPPIELDCLVTAVQAAYSGQAPYCSLDPHPKPEFQK